MDIHTNVPLRNLTTMKLGGNARFMAEVRTPQELAKICQNAKTQSLPTFVIGGGSNTIAKDDGFDGIIIRMRIPGFDVIAEDMNSKTIKIGAGEEWDSVVKKTVDMGLSGIEAMSAIPGTAGAAPVQNVGAFGQEIADTLVYLEAYDTATNTFGTLQSSECNFAYRDSIFRGSSAGRYIITSITLKLSKNQPQPPFYESLQKYLDENGIKIYTVQTIRDAVIKVRSNRLPDVKTTPNTGSFFKNAIVEKWQIEHLKSIDANMPMHEMADGRFKIPTGWLIEHAGLKGQLINGIRIYEKNALVLVNESASTYSDLKFARNQIINKIRDTYNIQIEQEPLEI